MAPSPFCLLPALKVHCFQFLQRLPSFPHVPNILRAYASPVTLCLPFHSTTAAPEPFPPPYQGWQQRYRPCRGDQQEKRGSGIRGPHSRHLRLTDRRESSTTALLRQTQGYPRMEPVNSLLPVVLLQAAAARLSVPTRERAKASSCFSELHALPQLVLVLDL